MSIDAFRDAIRTPCSSSKQTFTCGDLTLRFRRIPMGIFTVTIDVRGDATIPRDLLDGVDCPISVLELRSTGMRELPIGMLLLAPQVDTLNVYGDWTPGPIGALIHNLHLTTFTYLPATFHFATRGLPPKFSVKLVDDGNTLCIHRRGVW